jgi:hypothetical protein
MTPRSEEKDAKMENLQDVFAGRQE